MSFLCEYCNNSYTTKNHLTRHQNTEKCQYIKKLLEKKDKMYLEKINILEEINKTHIKQLEEYNNKINKYYLQVEEQNKEISGPKFFSINKLVQQIFFTTDNEICNHCNATIATQTHQHVEAR